MTKRGRLNYTPKATELKSDHRSLNYEQHYILFLYHYDYHEEFGPHYIFKFYHGYGASVIQDGKDKWELAVIRFHNDDSLDYDISYNTEITDDVIRGLTDQEVNNLLCRIQNLNEDGTEYVDDEPDDY